jgi:hypothetical protein
MRRCFSLLPVVFFTDSLSAQSNRPSGSNTPTESISGQERGMAHGEGEDRFTKDYETEFPDSRFAMSNANYRVTPGDTRRY